MSAFTLLILAASGAFGLLLAGLKRVPEGSAYTVHRFGRYVRTLPPGLAFVLPGIERVAQRVSLIGHAVPVQDEGLQGSVYYQILDPRQSGAALERIDQLVAGSAREALRSLRAATGGDEALDQRFRRHLNSELAPAGLRVVRCDLPLTH